MDMSKFLDDSFDAKEWINSAFQSHRDPSISKDQFAASLVMKLQKFIQEVNSVIEDTGQQVIQNMPKVLREIDAVKQEAELLRNQMSAMKQDIQKVEHDTSQSMQMIQKLDQIKERMVGASDALKEADNWTVLSADVEEVFLSQDIKAMTDKLSGLQQSLQMLEHTPNYSERCQYLERLKDQLEAHLSPQVVSALTSHSLEASVAYVEIFRLVNRVPQLQSYYHNCRKTELVDMWRSTLENHHDETPLEWLTKYLDLMVTSWHTEIEWCKRLFGEAIPIVCNLFTDSLVSLTPSVQSVFESFVDESPDPLQKLIHLKQVSERFSQFIENFVIQQYSGERGSQGELCELLSVVYAPYRSYISDYKSYEEAALLKSLDEIRLDHQDVIETVRLLSESVADLFQAAKLANERCVKFTDGFGYLQLISAYKTYFSSYSNEFRRILTNIWEKCRPEQYILEEDDWSNFQYCLRIIQSAGELVLHLSELEDLVVTDFLSTVGKLTTQTVLGSGVMSRFDEKSILLLNNVDDRVALKDAVIHVEEGDSSTLLSDIRSEMYSICEAAHKLAFEVAFSQISSHFTGLSQLPIWCEESAGGSVTSNLPVYGLSPQEHITKVGQYLMTLPQHLEPFVMEDNQAVIMALKYGKLPYIDKSDVSGHIAEVWLQSISSGLMQMYCDEILHIPKLTDFSTKQLIVDIEYVCNVLEDLDLHASPTILNIIKFLKMDTISYETNETNEHLARAIASMRSM